MLSRRCFRPREFSEIGVVDHGDYLCGTGFPAGYDRLKVGLTLPPELADQAWIIPADAVGGDGATRDGCQARVDGDGVVRVRERGTESTATSLTDPLRRRRASYAIYMGFSSSPLLSMALVRQELGDLSLVRQVLPLIQSSHA